MKLRRWNATYQRSRSGKLVCVVGPLLASLLLVLASAFLPLTVHRQSDLAQVRFGLPMQFLVQDQSRLTPPLPYRTSLSSPWEFPTRVLAVQLLLNTVIIFGLLCLVAVISRTIVRSVGRHRGTSDFG
ncbi:MAG TPA: hypothetical protein VJ714_06610 [Anaerolineae bacterium]|nr:hypothetical protein [Anaerolineae bacterium]